MGQGMRIAQIAPLCEAVPPKLYGGTERIVATLADEMVELGHEVTLFASGDARTKARLIVARDQAIRLDPHPLKSDLAAHLTMLADVQRRVDEFDLLHFHIDLMHFPMFEHVAERTVTTLHGRLDLKDLPAAYRRWPQYPLVSISDRQRVPLPFANWVATVHHGVSPELYRFFPKPDGGYLAFLGRISPEKRPDRAIALARHAGIPLKIAAKVDAVDLAYYRDVIAPMIDGTLVQYIGEIGDDRKSEFLGNALALLFPVDWPEPFGLVMIEAFACGTPVIAWNCGSVPEVVESGVTGEVVQTENEALAAVDRVRRFDRRKIRAAFELKYSATAMARRYLEVYAQLLDRHGGDEGMKKTA